MKYNPVQIPSYYGHRLLPRMADIEMDDQLPDVYRNDAAPEFKRADSSIDDESLMIRTVPRMDVVKNQMYVETPLEYPERTSFSMDDERLNMYSTVPSEYYDDCTPAMADIEMDDQLPDLYRNDVPPEFRRAGSSRDDESLNIKSAPGDGLRLEKAEQRASVRGERTCLPDRLCVRWSGRTADLQLVFYKYEDFDRVTKVEKKLSLTWLTTLHFLQFGIYLRHMGVMEMTVRKYLAFKGKGLDPGDVAVFLSHDVAMLRIVETFSESLPQLVLMVTTNIQRGHLDTAPVLKAVGSALAVSFTVMSYHRSLRSFLKNKHQQTPASSVVYFLWNLLLIAARVTALSLFASVLPCYIAVHFLCSWMVLFIIAWCCQTDFMDMVQQRWYNTSLERPLKAVSEKRIREQAFADTALKVDTQTCDERFGPSSSR
ncbi:hypothetical protein WMY93_019065 [Mugilogobius chulae]|uniref:XK-related protein n=1 Tax=Mugilogobius chulae TaxID=88201 RepID=A0AAW0NMZ9_9GOBI